MTVLGAPGEVFLLTHSVLRSHIGLPTTARVERIDPISLRTLEKSPALPGGPMWPGGMAVHGNGSLIAVYGRWAHKLDRHCRVQARTELPVNLPYNSFVVLDNGLIVTKNLSDTVNARLTVLEPERLQRAAPDTACPEPSIARLSSVCNTVYVVGVRAMVRYHWNAATNQAGAGHWLALRLHRHQHADLRLGCRARRRPRLVHGQRPAQLRAAHDRLGGEPDTQPPASA